MAFPFSQGVEDAIREHGDILGANEKPPGSNWTEMGKAFGMNPAFYCAIAIVVTTCIWGRSSAAMIRSASSWAIYQWHNAVGRTPSTPQRGDLIHVCKNGRSVHIERVLSFKGGRLICRGSNTSNTRGSTADGGGTYDNDRTAWWTNRNSNSGWSIKGISRPYYGVTTADVVLVQKLARIKQDGLMGPATKKALIVLQKQHGLTADGFPGPATMAALGGSTSKPATGGASNADILYVDKTQGWLNALGYSLTVDGKIGAATRAAVTAYQQAVGIPADGVPGPTTRQHLEADMATIDQIYAELMKVRPDIATVHDSVNDTPRRVMTFPVKRAGGQDGTTNPAAVIAWSDAHIVGTRTAVAESVAKIGQGLGLTDDQVQKIAAASAEAAAASVAQVNAQAIADQLTVQVKA